MTYCLGCVDGNAAYLIADSAVTSGEKPQSERTSFGERHHHDSKASVEERALKIFDLGSAALTFSGNVDLGYSFIEIVHKVLAAGEGPERAFQVGAQSVSSPTSSAALQVMMATYSEEGPKLTSYNERGDGLIREKRDLVQFGIVGPENIDFVPNLVSLAGPRTPDAAAKLAVLLGNIQSFSVRDCFMEQRGIGGVFTGLFIDSRGISWQSDMAYLLVNDEVLLGGDASNLKGHCISSIVRDNILVVRSPFSGGATGFTNSPDGTLDRQACIERSNEIAHEIHKLETEGRFDYVALIHTIRPIAAIVEMRKNRQTENFGFTPNGFGASEPLTKFIRGEQLQNPNVPHTQFFSF